MLLGRTEYRFLSPSSLVLRDPKNFKTNKAEKEKESLEEMQSYVLTQMSVNRGSCYLAPILHS